MILSQCLLVCSVYWIALIVVLLGKVFVLTGAEGERCNEAQMPIKKIHDKRERENQTRQKDCTFVRATCVALGGAAQPERNVLDKRKSHPDRKLLAVPKPVVLNRLDKLITFTRRALNCSNHTDGTDM